MQESSTLGDWRDYVQGRAKKYGLTEILRQLPRELRSRFDPADSPAALKQGLRSHNEYIDSLQPFTNTLKDLDPNDQSKILKALHGLHDTPTDNSVEANRDLAAIIAPLAFNHPSQAKKALVHLSNQIQYRSLNQMRKTYGIGSPRPTDPEDFEGLSKALELHTGYMDRMSKKHRGTTGTVHELLDLPTDRHADDYFAAIAPQIAKLYHADKMKGFLHDVAALLKNQIPASMAQLLRDLYHQPRFRDFALLAHRQGTAPLSLQQLLNRRESSPSPAHSSVG